MGCNFDKNESISKDLKESRSKSLNYLEKTSADERDSTKAEDRLLISAVARRLGMAGESRLEGWVQKCSCQSDRLSFMPV